LEQEELVRTGRVTVVGTGGICWNEALAGTEALVGTGGNR
jgi:hypothetical protein